MKIKTHSVVFVLLTLLIFTGYLVERTVLYVKREHKYQKEMSTILNEVSAEMSLCQHTQSEIAKSSPVAWGRYVASSKYIQSLSHFNAYRRLVTTVGHDSARLLNSFPFRDFSLQQFGWSSFYYCSYRESWVGILVIPYSNGGFFVGEHLLRSLNQYKDQIEVVQDLRCHMWPDHTRALPQSTYKLLLKKKDKPVKSESSFLYSWLLFAALFLMH